MPPDETPPPSSSWSFGLGHLSLWANVSAMGVIVVLLWQLVGDLRGTIDGQRIELNHLHQDYAAQTVALSQAVKEIERSNLSFSQLARDVLEIRIQLRITMASAGAAVGGATSTPP